MSIAYTFEYISPCRSLSKHISVPNMSECLTFYCLLQTKWLGNWSESKTEVLQLQLSWLEKQGKSYFYLAEGSRELLTLTVIDPEQQKEGSLIIILLLFSRVRTLCEARQILLSNLSGLLRVDAFFPLNLPSQKIICFGRPDKWCFLSLGLKISINIFNKQAHEGSRGLWLFICTQTTADLEVFGGKSMIKLTWGGNEAIVGSQINHF